MIRIFLLWIGSFCLACQSTETQQTSSPPPAAAQQASATQTSQAVPVKEDPAFDQDYLMGKFNPAKHPDFVLIAPKYASRSGMYLHQDVYRAFQEMWAAAQKDGIQLTILSATRNFNRQKAIWEAKWNGNRKVEGKNLSKAIADPNQRAIKILEYSSMPGTSRHHWGSDLDINALQNAYFKSGKGKKVYEWMTQNAANYGFCQPYTPKGEARPDGYNEERWHWSYLPLAKRLSDQYKTKVHNKDIVGFNGASTAADIDVVSKYVFGINADCL